MASNKYLLKQEFVENISKRIPVCFVIDCSASMYKKDYGDERRIERVNEGIRLFYDSVKQDPKTKDSVDIMIISVANEAKIVKQFSGSKDYPENLYPLQECGDLAKGIELAIREVDKRKKVYVEEGVSHYQPWLIVMSDGVPTRRSDNYWERYDNIGAENDLRQLQEEIIKPRERNEKLVVFPILISNNTQKGIDCISNFSNDPNRLIKFDATTTSFNDLFLFLHQSASSVASGKGFITSEKFGGGEATFNRNEPSPVAATVVRKVGAKPEKKTIEIKAVQSVEDEELKREIDKAKKIKERTKTPAIEEEPQQQKELVFSIFVNGAQVHPITLGLSSEKATYSLYLNKGDRIIVKQGDSVLRFANGNVVEMDGRYQLTAKANGKAELNIRIRKQQKLDEDVSKINKEIADIIKNKLDWDAE